jgi:hypothetical protein
LKKTWARQITGLVELDTPSLLNIIVFKSSGCSCLEAGSYPLPSSTSPPCSLLCSLGVSKLMTTSSALTSWLFILYTLNGLINLVIGLNESYKNFSVFEFSITTNKLLVC